MRRLCSLRSVHAPPIRYVPTLLETGYETGYGCEGPPTVGRSVGPYATTRTRTRTRTRDTCSICSLRSLPAVLVKPPESGTKRSRTCAPEPNSPLSRTTCAPRSRGLVLHALLCSTLSDRENERERERAIEREYERERASESTQD